MSKSFGRWIPVTERMPGKDEFFLAYGSGLGAYIGGPEIEICRWFDGLWNEGGTEATDARFTHWMLLPRPPEK